MPRLCTVVLTLLASCGRTPEPGFECAVFNVLLGKLTHGDRDSEFQKQFSLFVGQGSEENARDLEQRVLACIRREWPVRPVSESIPVEVPLNLMVRERGSDERGWLVWIGESTHFTPDEIKVQCGLCCDGTAYEIYELIMHNVANGWVVQSERRIALGEASTRDWDAAGVQKLPLGEPSG